MTRKKSRRKIKSIEKKIIKDYVPYTEELGLLICEITAITTVGLKQLCKDYPWMPNQTSINRWMWKHEEFRLLYVQAKEFQADLLGYDCLDIADDVTNDSIFKTDKNGEQYEVANNEWIQRSRLRVETRQWMARQLKPKVWGDARHMKDLEGQNNVLLEELRTIRAELDAKSQKEF